MINTIKICSEDGEKNVYASDGEIFILILIKKTEYSVKTVWKIVNPNLGEDRSSDRTVKNNSSRNSFLRHNSKHKRTWTVNGFN